MPAKKIALFIDADNISSRYGKQILDTLENRGEIFIRRIYGNWEKVPLHSWNDCVLNFSLRAVQQPDFATGKNATDMSLTIDAMDVLHDGKAEIFALVSNDSDFTPLAIRLREGGMKVIGLGNTHASAAFRAACHEFIDLDAAEEIQNPQPSKVEKKSSAEKKSDVQLSLFAEENVDRFQSDADKIRAIHDALREATELHGDAEGFVLLNYGRLVLRDKNFGFTVKDFGYGQLRDFIVAFPEVYEVRGEGKDFSYRCRVAQIPQPTHDAEKILDADKLQPIHDTLREVVQLHGDEKGFALLSWAGDALGKKNLSMKDSGHSTLKNFLGAFPNLYEVTGEGTEISYRCLTLDRLQAIHDTLHEVAAAHGDEKGFATLSWAGDALGKKNLNIKDSGHGTLKNFLGAFPNLYEVTGEGTEISYRCLPLDRLQPIHDTLREVAAAHGDEKGFATLSWAGDALGKKNLNIKDSGHGTLKNFLAAFPNLYEVTGEGTEISYRCRTLDKLQAIHDTLREVAEAHGDADGFTNLGLAGSAFSQKNLSVKDSGHSSLSKLISAFPNLYEVKVDNGAYFYRCLPLDKLQPIHEVLRETALLHEDSAGFVDLWWACDTLSKKNLPPELKSFSHKDLLEFISKYPARYELVQRGLKEFFYRCLTLTAPSFDAAKLQQIHDTLREVVQLHGDEKGFVLLSWVGDALIKKNLRLKGSGHSTVKNFLAAFPNLYEVKGSNGSISYRCR